ncbi:hypothetical protein TRIP_E160217 [uncultured Spirochaetota bacterium]|nr:hypothetical protein TRIP_E160217 [uncultured Spirochaetota bacterium]
MFSLFICISQSFKEGFYSTVKAPRLIIQCEPHEVTVHMGVFVVKVGKPLVNRCPLTWQIWK